MPPMDPRTAALPAPTPDELAHSTRLVEHIAGEIAAAGGWLPFDRYMDLALYAPGLGYYAAGAVKLGDSAAGGDFVTAPELSPYFGRALAVQVAQLFDQTPARIVEFGAGSGRLARDVLATLRALGRPCERYAIVEVSPDLRARQRACLAGETVEWLSAPPDRWDGVLIANEVLDVMPVRVFVREKDGVRERGVSSDLGRLALRDRPADAELAAAVAAIEAVVGPLPVGYVSEVGFIARAWMAAAADWIGRGALLALDYGFPCREYYHPQRLMGTLMCHFRHHAHAEPLWLPGLNDVTAHVDFTALASVAHDAGLDVLGYTSQAHFLINCGLLDALQAASAAERAAAQRLVSEAEMGELFKVLAVGRGIAGPLRGFAHGDRTHRL
jgi:SAM-dependent MidA family methyltransferase